jgi:hypothetical protein
LRVPSKRITLVKNPRRASTNCSTVAFPRRPDGLNVASAAVVNTFFHFPSNMQSVVAVTGSQFHLFFLISPLILAPLQYAV